MITGPLASQIPILKDLVIIMALALITIYLAHKLKIPSIVSFLSVGLIIGPSSLALIKEPHQIEILAEIGVIFLLFTIGIEFSIKRLLKIKKYTFIGGGLQVLFTTASVLFIAMAFGIPPNKAIYFGFLASLSSTAIVLKLYADRGEVYSPHGNIAVGILLFQDLCMVPMMLLVPSLGFNAQGGGGAFALIVVKSVLAIGGIIVAARLFFPWIMEKMVATRIRESFTLTIILFCLGTAWLTSKIGLSLSLGAFIAGLIISESEYSYQAISEIIPMTDSFAGLFFISIGMLLDIGFLYKNLLVVFSIIGLILLLKASILFLVAILVKKNLRIAIILSLGLAQIGEFSFILAQLGMSNGLMSYSHYQHFLAASIISMLITPLFVHFAPVIAFRIQSLWPGGLKKQDSEGFLCPLQGHVLIIGYGLNGRNLAKVLKETGIPYQIVDLNSQNISQGKEDGHPIFFGDASRREILERLAVKCAKIAVIAISDPSASRRIVWQTKRLNPNIYLIVRTRYVSEVEELYNIGADQVIPEEFETSVEIFSHVLHRFRVPRNVIDLHISMIRDSGYGMLRGSSLPDEHFDNIQKIISQMLTETFMVSDDSPAVGRSLAELALRAKTGVTVMGIIRDDRSITNPEPKIEIKAGDILIMFGSHMQLDQAVDMLSRNKS